MFSGRLVRSCQSSAWHFWIRFQRSSLAPAGASSSKMSARLAQKTRRRTPAFSAALFQASGFRQFAAEVRRLVAPGPHFVQPYRDDSVSA